MNVTLLQNVEAVWKLAPAWRALARNHPLHSPEWMLAWWQHLGHGELLVLVCQDERGEAQGIAPFFLEHGRLQSRIRFLATGKACTDYVAVLMNPACARQVAQCFAKFLHEYCRSLSPLRRVEIELEAIDPSAAWYQHFTGALRDYDFSIWLHPIQNSYRVALPASYDDLLARMSKPTRRKVRTALKTLETGTLVYQETYQPDELRARFSTLVDLHHWRRRSLGEEGCFDEVPFNEFVVDATERLAHRCQASLRWCETAEGRPAAINLSFEDDQSVYIYQTGFDPRTFDLQPGNALNAACIRKSIEQGKLCYDLLRGDERYKSSWTAEAIPLAVAHCSPPRVVSKLGHAIAANFDQAKRYVRNLRQKPAGIGATQKDRESTPVTQES